MYLIQYLLNVWFNTKYTNRHIKTKNISIFPHKEHTRMNIYHNMVSRNHNGKLIITSYFESQLTFHFFLFPSFIPQNIYIIMIIIHSKYRAYVFLLRPWKCCDLFVLFSCGRMLCFNNKKYIALTLILSFDILENLT